MQTTGTVCIKTSVRPRWVAAFFPLLHLALYRERQARRSDTFPPQGRCLCPGLAAEPPSHRQPWALPNPSSRGEEQELSLPRDRDKPGTSFRGAPHTGDGRGHHRSPFPAAGRAGPARRTQERGSLGRQNPTFSSVLHQRLLPARPPPHRGKDGGRGRRCSPGRPRAGADRAEVPAALPAHAAQRAAHSAPFVFLNHAAAPALRPIRSAAASPANGGRPRGFLNRPSPPIAAQRAPPSPAPALLTTTGSNGYERQRPPRARPSPGVAWLLTSERQTANPVRPLRQGAELRAV